MRGKSGDPPSEHRKILVHSGVAAHHAGHIPAWKLLVEKMMSAGLLNAIFATSTVAAGVDFPARAVVMSNADARGNNGWRPLTASELQQMTGRAGRRGRDNVGFVVLAPGQFQNLRKIAELLKAKPDPLESQFRHLHQSAEPARCIWKFRTGQGHCFQELCFSRNGHLARSG